MAPPRSLVHAFLAVLLTVSVQVYARPQPRGRFPMEPVTYTSEGGRFKHLHVYRVEWAPLSSSASVQLAQRVQRATLISSLAGARIIESSDRVTLLALARHHVQALLRSSDVGDVVHLHQPQRLRTPEMEKWLQDFGRNRDGAAHSHVHTSSVSHGNDTHLKESSPYVARCFHPAKPHPQEAWDATSRPFEQYHYRERSKKFHTENVANDTSIRFEFKVAFHVILKNSAGEGNVTDAQLTKQIEVLNAAFNQSQYGLSVFGFKLHSINRVVNSNWYLGCGSDQETSMKQANNLDPTQYINVYLCDPGAQFLGYAYLPSQMSEDNVLMAVVLKTTSVPDGPTPPYNEGDTGTHEIGHYFGLYHTFENGCSSPGDRVDDTNYEKEAHYGCGSRTTCGTPDPTTNFMDYSDDSCMNHFTHGQGVRMHAQMAAGKPIQYAAAQIAAAVCNPNCTSKKICVQTNVCACAPCSNSSQALNNVTCECTDVPATPSPTNAPTPSPTRAPTGTPTRSPTAQPTTPPTSSPTPSPTVPGATPVPTVAPTSAPTSPPSTCNAYTQTASSASHPYVYYDISGHTKLGMSTADVNFNTITLPFPFNFWCTNHTSARVYAAGFVRFSTSTVNEPWTNLNQPLTNSIAALWDDWYPFGSGDVYFGTVGSAPSRIAVVSWVAVKHFNGNNQAANKVTFQIHLHESNNSIGVHYNDVVTNNAAFTRGKTATVGIRGGSSEVVLHSYNTANAVNSQTALFFSQVVSSTPAPSPGPTRSPTNTPSPTTPGTTPSPTQDVVFTPRPTVAPSPGPTRSPTNTPSPTTPGTTPSPTQDVVFTPRPTVAPTSSPTSAPAVTSVSFTRTNGASLPTNILSLTAARVQWATQGGVTKVSILAVPVNTSLALPVLVARDLQSSPYTFDPRNIEWPAAGNYMIRVVFNNQVSGSSASFFADPCILKSCSNGGSCSNGECQCVSPYSGDSCQTSPCSSVTCSNGGACNVSSGACVGCQNGYSGRFCDVPPACSLDCQNGGRVVSAGSNACGTCSCQSPWTGTTCTTCNLQCVRGSALTNCSACKCPARVSGTLCDRVFLQLLLGPFVLAPSLVSDSFSTFSSNFASDLAAALNITLSRVVVLGFLQPSSGRITVRFRLLAAGVLSTSAAPKTGAPPSLQADFGLSDEATDIAALQVLFEELKVALRDANGELFRGVVTSSLSSSAAVTEDNGDDGASGGDGITISPMLMAAAGAVVVVLVIALIWYKRRQRNQPIAGGKGEPDVDGGGGVPMSNFPAQRQSAMIGMARAPPSALPSQQPLQGNPLYKQAPAASQYAVGPAQHAPQQANAWGQPGLGYTSNDAYQATGVQSAASSRANSPLPPHWQQFTSDDGYTYYFNEVTNESSWDRPVA